MCPDTLMLREVAKKHQIGMNKEFRNRGEQTTRIESFSDAVFALALTLVIISSQPPRTYQEMQVFLWEAGPFFFCIALITMIWYEHYKFFLRYGFGNRYIIFLNTVLLSTVLIYVYPLRFLSRMLLAIFTNNSSLFTEIIAPQDIPWLMAVYGTGAALIFFLFALMYSYAYKHAKELELNAIERFDTYSSILGNMLMGAVPLLSVIISITSSQYIWSGSLAGFIYFLYMPIMFIYGFARRKKRNALLSLGTKPEEVIPMQGKVPVMIDSKN
jgi:uncharacterized membrane protein